MKNLGPGLKRILVVEDEPAICEVCRRVLSSEGFEIDIANNGKEAQKILGKKQYALCLIDIRTPEMSGKEFYQWLADEHPHMADKVIFTTGDVMSGDTQGFLERSAKPFLPKPFSPDELRTLVRETLKEMRK